MGSTHATQEKSQKPDRAPLLISLIVSVLLGLHYTLLAYPACSPYLGVADNLFYVPIVWAAYRYGLRGGFSAAAIIMIGISPHVIIDWPCCGAAVNVSRAIGLVLYLGVGLSVGVLSDRRHASERQLTRASGDLRVACDDLREKSQELSQAYSQLRSRTKEVFEWQEHARRADKFSALTRMSEGLAHELRNPLGSINGAVAILRGKTLEGVDGEMLEIIDRESSRLNRVVEDFMAFARQEEKCGQSSSLDEAVMAVCDSIADEARDRNIEIRYDAEAMRLRLAVPEVHLRQAIHSLLVNALHAIGRDGAIVINAGHEAGRTMARVTIEDTGPGVAKEIVRSLFDPFFTTTDESTGLGLAIVQRIAMDCGGSVVLDESCEVGARFVMSLPVATDESCCPLKERG